MTSPPSLSGFFSSLGRCGPREGVSSPPAVEGYLLRGTRATCRAHRYVTHRNDHRRMSGSTLEASSRRRSTTLG